MYDKKTMQKQLDMLARRIFANEIGAMQVEEALFGRNSHAFEQHLDRSDVDLINRAYTENKRAASSFCYPDDPDISKQLMMSQIVTGIIENFDEFYGKYAEACREGGWAAFDMTIYDEEMDMQHGFKLNDKKIEEHETQFFTVRFRTETHDPNLMFDFYIETAYPEFSPDIEQMHKTHPDLKKTDICSHKVKGKDYLSELKETDYYKKQPTIVQTFLEKKNNPQASRSVNISFEQRTFGDKNVRGDDVIFSFRNTKSEKGCQVIFKSNVQKERSHPIGGAYRSGEVVKAYTKNDHGVRSEWNLRTSTAIDKFSKTNPAAMKEIEAFWSEYQRREELLGHQVSGLQYDTPMIQGVDINRTESLAKIEAIDIDRITQQQAKLIYDKITSINDSMTSGNGQDVDEKFYLTVAKKAGVTTERNEIDNDEKRTLERTKNLSKKHNSQNDDWNIGE